MSTPSLKGALPATKGLLLCCVVMFLNACASYSGSTLVPGQSSQADVRNLMGAPATIHAGRGESWSESWEYPRGPFGRDTYMLRFSTSGVLLQIEQVLSLASISKVRIGETDREGVRRLLGRPALVTPYGKDGELWDYAALSSDGMRRRVRLGVVFGSDGLALSAGESEERRR